MNRIYFDNASTTRPFDEVISYMAHIMSDSYGNPSSAHIMGQEAERELKEARKNIERLSENNWEKIYFTSGGTESNNWAIFSSIEKMKHYGKSIVLSCVEHPSVREAFYQMEKRGFKIIEIPVDDKCRLDVETFRQAMDEDVIFSSIMKVNNETGSIFPVDELYKLKRRESLFHSDCIQALGKIKLPKVDIISGSGHKFHGPKGVGVLALKEGVKIPPIFYGGGQEENLRSGTENLQSISGLSIAAKKMQEVDKNSIKMMRDTLRKELEDSLRDIVINTPDESLGNILNISFLGTKSEVILHKLEMDKIFVSSGSACSTNKKSQSHVLKAMGLEDEVIDSAIRFSFSSFNTMDEIFYSVEKIKKAVKDMRNIMKFRGRR